MPFVIRVRFAPSPTGNLHIGTIRTALFNWLFARNKKGTLIVRIEDTDPERSKPEFEKNILDGMSWLGLDFDEGPIRQSQRMSLYKEAAQKLLESKAAYRCYCTDAELEAERKEAEIKKVPYVYSGKCATLTEPKDGPFTVRFAVPKRALKFHDIIRDDIEFDLNLVGDFVIVKSDGGPTYNFACVVDDIDMKISHVIRGEDHVSNTPRQIIMYEALGQKPPEFAHLPMILGTDKSKLSKRHGATAVTDYAAMGFLPEALFNYMVLLGWSSPDAKEIMTRDEIASVFSLERISKSGAVFDITKLKWMNGQYIRKLNPDELYERVTPYLPNSKISKEMVYSVRDNLEVLADITNYLAVYTMTDDEYKQAVKQFQFSDSDLQVLNLLTAKLSNPMDVQRILDEIIAETGLGRGKVLKPVRLACTGAVSGPQLPDCLPILGLSCLQNRLHGLLATSSQAA